MPTGAMPTKGHYWPPSSFNGIPDGEKGRFIDNDTGSMVSFNHNLRNLGHGDEGGPWLLEKHLSTYNFGHFENANGLGYKGPTLPNPVCPLSQVLLGAVRSDSSYYSDGAKAIAATEPTNAIFNGSVAIGETMSDGLPSLIGAETWKAKTLRAKQAGGEYLNYQFGWIPFVSDLHDFARAVKSTTDVVHQYQKRGEMRIRKHLELGRDLHTETTQVTQAIRNYGQRNIGSTLTSWSTTVDDRTWFDGCFRLYVPMDNSMRSRLKRYRLYARQLYGAELTPETVWNIAPWSWAIDWKTDIGAIIHNYSALGHNGLVLQYGYVMHEQHHTTVASAGRWGTSAISSIRKRRVAANPYGFGVSLSSLNPQQTAVLAALGMSRGNARIIR